MDIYWFGWFTIANLIDSLHSEVVRHVFVEIVYGNCEVFADLTIGDIKFITVLSHLLDIIPSDGRATITARGLPSKCNSVFGPFSVVKLLWGRWYTWKLKIKYKMPMFISAFCTFRLD